MLGSPSVNRRKTQLIEEARLLLEALKEFGDARSQDPWTDPATLAEAIREGLLDAPHFRGNPHLCGKVTTRLIEGAWYAVDERGKPLAEGARIETVLRRRSAASGRPR